MLGTGDFVKIQLWGTCILKTPSSSFLMPLFIHDSNIPPCALFSKPHPFVGEFIIPPLCDHLPYAHTHRVDTPFVITLAGVHTPGSYPAVATPLLHGLAQRSDLYITPPPLNPLFVNLVRCFLRGIIKKATPGGDEHAVIYDKSRVRYHDLPCIIIIAGDTCTHPSDRWVPTTAVSKPNTYEVLRIKYGRPGLTSPDFFHEFL